MLSSLPLAGVHSRAKPSPPGSSFGRNPAFGVLVKLCSLCSLPAQPSCMGPELSPSQQPNIARNPQICASAQKCEGRECCAFDGIQSHRNKRSPCTNWAAPIAQRGELTSAEVQVATGQLRELVCRPAVQQRRHKRGCKVWGRGIVWAIHKDVCQEAEGEVGYRPVELPDRSQAPGPEVGGTVP